MNKYILQIEGMRCGMCEMHLQDAIRKNIKANKVKASYVKKEVIVFSELDLTENDFHQAIDTTGYEIKGILKQEAKKGLLGWK